MTGNQKGLFSGDSQTAKIFWTHHSSSRIKKSWYWQIDTSILFVKKWKLNLELLCLKMSWRFGVNFDTIFVGLLLQSFPRALDVAHRGVIHVMSQVALLDVTESKYVLGFFIGKLIKAEVAPFSKVTKMEDYQSSTKKSQMRNCSTLIQISNLD